MIELSGAARRGGTQSRVVAAAAVGAIGLGSWWLAAAAATHDAAKSFLPEGSWLSGLLIALLIAISSSTDNFAIGISVALTGSPLSPVVNGMMASCNSVASFLSTSLGGVLGALAPTIAPLAAAIIFFYVAYEEIMSWRRGEESSPLAKLAAMESDIPR